MFDKKVFSSCQKVSQIPWTLAAVDKGYNSYRDISQAGLDFPS